MTDKGPARVYQHEIVELPRPEPKYNIGQIVECDDEDSAFDCYAVGPIIGISHDNNYNGPDNITEYIYTVYDEGSFRYKESDIVRSV